jgi:hypothetical protein
MFFVATVRHRAVAFFCIDLVCISLTPIADRTKADLFAGGSDNS